MIELKGILIHGKKVVVDEGIVTITDNLLTHKKKTIPIESIVAVQIKRCGLEEGYIYFQTIGGMGNNRFKTREDFVREENVITFMSSKKYKLALEIKNYIEEYQINQRRTQNVNVGSGSNADELKKFKQLLDEGIISKQEFESKKKQLLGI